MTTKYQILQLLEQSTGRLLSGGEIAERLSISRTAVWKQISALQQEGYQITAEPSKGYLLSDSDVISEYEIRKRLQTHTLGQVLRYFPIISSPEPSKTVSFQTFLVFLFGWYQKNPLPSRRKNITQNTNTESFQTRYFFLFQRNIFSGFTSAVLDGFGFFRFFWVQKDKLQNQIKLFLSNT